MLHSPSKMTWATNKTALGAVPLITTTTSYYKYPLARLVACEKLNDHQGLVMLTVHCFRGERWKDGPNTHRMIQRGSCTHTRSWKEPIADWKSCRMMGSVCSFPSWPNNDCWNWVTLVRFDPWLFESIYPRSGSLKILQSTARSLRRVSLCALALVVSSQVEMEVMFLSMGDGTESRPHPLNQSWCWLMNHIYLLSAIPSFCTCVLEIL